MELPGKLIKTTRNLSLEHQSTDQNLEQESRECKAKPLQSALRSIKINLIMYLKTDMEL
jgi:hypothetical protein